MAHLKFLEQFEGDDCDLKGPLAEDLPGFSEGFEAGMAAATADTKRLNAQVVDKITDIRFGYAEAQKELLGALTPLINALCDQILPDILDDITRSKLFETLILAAESDLKKPITITFHPDKAQVAEDLSESTQGFDLQILTDAKLGANEVLISTHQQETQLDVSALINDLRAALQIIPTQSKDHI